MTTLTPTPARKSIRVRRSIVAASAALALLGAGGFSLASWSANVGIGGFDPEIHFGTLAAHASPASRTLNGTTVSPMTGVVLSPGDTLVTTVPLTVDSSGNTLTAKATLDFDGWTSDADESVLDQIESWATVELVPTADALANGATLNGDGTVSFASTAAPASRTANVVVTVAVPFDEAGNDLRGIEAALEGLAVAVDQVEVTNN